jgi:hypothetical protein
MTMHTSLRQSLFIKQHRASAFFDLAFPAGSCIMLMHRFRRRDIVPSLAPQIRHLIRQTASFEEPVSKQWAIPISAPYTPDTSPSVAFVSRVMGRITQGYADALVAGGSFRQVDANAFKDELRRVFGVHITYQTVFARKESSG